MQKTPPFPANPPPRRIALCADDFGLHADVDAGIVALIEAGRLTATSCLTSAPGWPRHAPRLAGLPADVGLHLNFSEAFEPRDEICLPLPQLIRASYLRALPKSRIAAQIERQLDAFEAHYGNAPDFVDGHQHVHQLPVIRDCLLAILARRYAGQRLWLRSTLAPAALPASRFKAATIAALGARRFVALARRAGWTTNARLLGVYDFRGDEARYRALLRGWLKVAGERDILMCHPAVSAVPGDAIGGQRPVEFAVLSDAGFDDWLAAAGLAPARLSALR